MFCNKPILQFPNPTKDYVLYTDASNNVYSSVLCQPQSNDKVIRPVAYFSGTFTAQNKHHFTLISAMIQAVYLYTAKALPNEV